MGRWRAVWSRGAGLASVATAAVLLSAVLAGCGGAGGGSEVAQAADSGDRATTGDAGTSTVAVAADPEEAQLAFARCMREQGVDFPDPSAGDDGRIRFRAPAGGEADREAMSDAMEACREHLDAVRPELTDEQRQEMEDQRLEFARCMREQGVDMPDPGAGGEMTPGAGGRVDLDDPAAREAFEACREEAGGGPMGPGGPGGPGPSRPGGAR